MAFDGRIVGKTTLATNATLGIEADMNRIARENTEIGHPKETAAVIPGMPTGSLETLANRI